WDCAQRERECEQSASVHAPFSALSPPAIKSRARRWQARPSACRDIRARCRARPAGGIVPPASRRDPTMQRPAHWAAVLALAALLLPAERAAGEDYPNHSVTVIAPSAPGGMYSILARLIAAKLEQRYGTSFVVENRPGASSITGAMAVVRSPPDGYTLMVAASTTMATNVALHKNLPYDPRVDFVPVTLIALTPEVLLVNAALPVRSIDDLVKLARAT